ncbi:TIM barrel protein [Alcaligenes faecalis]|uniref:hydroxypyruvate isomerase family protein n=1 Tax=Alcaligenes aquatilis TaxID=323284 RepID=UPI000E866D30|nr:TIM barrel protein [Alcaligenes faecalis]HBQ90207.1 hydroxypyruvate isomerase [Alcaligenes faecalis]
MQLSANLSWLYRHLDWSERFEAAAADGFKGVEILLPYDYAPAWYAQQLQTTKLELTLINTPIGEGQGRLGWAAIPGAQTQFRQAFDRARAVAQATGCRRIHVMAGDVSPFAQEDGRAALISNLEHALALAEADDLVLTLEALNRSDMAGYFYYLPEQVIEVLQHFNSPRLRLQFDYYHCVKESLDVRSSVAACAPWIGYVQIAGADGRYEPDLAQHDLLEGVAALPSLGYDAWLGCEYQPRALPSEGLAWCQPLRDRSVLAVPHRHAVACPQAAGR